MKCIEAQSRIINFLNNDVESSDEISLIEHYKTCKECREELEIQYIILRGLQQLEAEEDTFIYDFQNELSLELDRRCEAAIHKINTRQISRLSFVYGIIILILLIILRLFL